MRCVIDTRSKSSIRATMMFFDSGSVGQTIILEAHRVTMLYPWIGLAQMAYTSNSEGWLAGLFMYTPHP